jgi:hypothetical protein
MRAALVLLAALVAAVYHLLAGTLFLGIALLVVVALYPLARSCAAAGSAERPLRRRHPRAGVAVR